MRVPFAGVRTFGSDQEPHAFAGHWRHLRALKINLWGNDGGDTAAAVIPYVKAPSAPIGIGNGAMEGGLIRPVA